MSGIGPMKFQFVKILQPSIIQFLAVILFLPIDLKSQKPAEENPLKISEWIVEMRKNDQGVWDQGKRWEAFVAMRSQMMRKSSAVPVAQWISLGPNTIDNFSGRMISHAFDPTDPTMIYAGSASGGLWRSTTAGNSWEPMMREFPSMEISAIAINPKNRNEIIIGTGVDKFSSLSIRPGVGVFRSTDRGMTWELTSYSYLRNQSIGVSRIIWDPIDSISVYMAATNGIWKSTDHGENWTLKKAGRASALVLNKKNRTTLFTLFYNSGIHRSTDAGETWQLQSNGVPTGTTLGYTSLAICDSVPEVIIASITSASDFSLIGLYRTINSGESWSPMNRPAMDYVCQPSDQTQCQGWFCNAVGISPVDPQVVLVGGVTFWNTQDGGAEWSQVDVMRDFASLEAGGKRLTYVDQMDIGFDPLNPNVVYVFNDGGVQRSSNQGQTWDKKNNGLVTAQLFRIANAPSDTNILTGGMQDHGLQSLNNANGNVLWKRWYANDGIEVIIHPTNPSILYGNVLFGVVFKSTTGGTSWMQSTKQITTGITESGKVASALVMDPLRPETLYTAMNTKIFRTTNGGANWNALASIANIFTMAVDPVNPDILYAHSYTNSNWTIWRSKNAGANWDAISHVSIPSWRVVDLVCDPVVTGTVYAVRNSASSGQDHVKRSSDFGETWSDITSNLPDITTNAITISHTNNQHLYVATDLGVFASTNGGGDWFEFNDGMPVAYASDISYHPIDRSVRVATLGRGVYKTKAIDVISGIASQESKISPSEFTIANNYPNPFNPSTSIVFTLPRAGVAETAIFNHTGQEVYVFPRKEYSSGSHSLTWNGTNAIGQTVSTGTYYCRVVYEHFAKTVKLSLVK